MKRKQIGKRAAAAVLAVVLLLSCAFAADYSDVSGHWGEAEIARWSDYGVIQGSGGKFRPNDTITRAELAVILQRVMQYGAAKENPYRDLSDTWYTDSILRLSAAGILQGSNGLVRPGDPITRQEAAVLFARAFELETTGTSDAGYTDGKQIASWASGAVNAMYAGGYMKGSGGLFRPQSKITRAEVVKILDNLVAAYYREAGTYTGNVDGNVLIGTGDVTLKEMTISGDLIIAPGAANGTVTLEKVTVGGSILNQSGRDIVIKEDEPEPDPNAPLVTEEEKAAFLAQYPDQGLIGIDVARYQGEIDWAKVKAAGVEFAIIRVGFTGYGTGTLNLDANYQANIEGALENGIKVGVYYYSQAISVEEAQAEAALLLDAIRGYDITFPVVFDWETVSSASGRANNLDTQTLCDAANAFCKMVKDAGYTPMVYFNKKLATDYYDLDQIQEHDFWYAYYQSSASIPTGHDHMIWQFTSTGKVPGISGNVDLDLSYFDYGA